MRWKNRNPKGDIIRVFYGHDYIPSTTEKAVGGIVKIQDLQTLFPNQKENADILYLVSSALPYFPVRMARFAKKGGAKLVVNQNGVAYPGWYGEGWKQANKSMRQLLQMADYVVYQSKFCKKSADQFLGKRTDIDHDILYNPVDTSFFRKITKAASLNTNVVLLLAGSHCSWYRVKIALETLKEIRKIYQNVSLRIAGQMCWVNDEQAAKREAYEYGESLGVVEYFEMTGIYTQQEAPEIFSHCSILLHTKYNDPCPRLVVEAMACGLPVVYSATGGVAELVGEEAGVGVQGPLDWEKDHPPNAVELAIAVEKVIIRLDQFSAAARSRAVQELDVKYWLQRHKEIFQQVLL